MQEMWVRSLGLDHLLEEGMATHSRILAWKIPWPEEPGGLWSIGSQRVRHSWATDRCRMCLDICLLFGNFRDSPIDCFPGVNTPHIKHLPQLSTLSIAVYFCQVRMPVITGTWHFPITSALAFGILYLVPNHPENYKLTPANGSGGIASPADRKFLLEMASCPERSGRVPG